MSKSTDYIASLAKGLRVLDCFGAETPKLSVSDVAEKSGLDRASARRCLLTLHSEGYTDYDGKFFTPTTRVLRLGTGTLAALPMPQIVQPWIDQLSEKIGESVSVSILDETEIVYVARAAQRKVMSIGLMPGSRLLAHTTSMGRVLLAALPEQAACALVEASDLTPRTPYSQTNPSVIMNEIAKVREQGYALIDQEVEIGLRSLAVPIFGSRGEVEAAMNVGVAAVQSSADQLLTQYLDELIRVRDGIKRLLR